MANPIQAASTQRKIIYLAVIVGLFTVTLFWRGTIPLPLSGNVEQVASLNRMSILRQAERLELRELDQGDPEIVGHAAQVALTGTRGIAVTILWRAAIEKQKRGEFHDMETYARLVTRLQPNFTIPWLFQSWNLAYNVSVENDRLNDMYFYISRGIELLAEGERLNKMSPDMRFQTAFYYQNKFSVSDKVTTLRSLMQVSCIPPPERDPSQFYNDDKTINAKAFEEFCRKNPQLVKRLREKLDCRRPEQVVQFLADNVQIPSRYIPKTGSLNEPELQFPVLPPPFERGADEYHAGSSNFDDRFDAFHASRAWYSYAQTVIPPNPTDSNGQSVPTGVIRLSGTDRFKYRIPRSPALIVFRQGPPRSQSYLAERLTKEGWYDAKTAWKPDEFRDPSSYWFKKGDLDQELAFQASDSSQVQWAKAFEMWEKHGLENAMFLTQTRQLALDKLAERVPHDTAVLQWQDEDPFVKAYTKEAVDARKALISLEQNKSVTNFDYFHRASEAESDSLTVDARKRFGDAALQDSQGDYDRALSLNVLGMNAWRQVLVKHEKFHRSERSERTDEETYEVLMKMTDLVSKEFERPDKRKLLEAKYAMATAAFGGLYPASGKVDLDRAYAEDEVNARISALDRRVQERVDEMLGSIDALASPLASLADKNAIRGKPARAALARQIVEREFEWLKLFTDQSRSRPWVQDSTVEQVRSRLGLTKRLSVEPDPNAVNEEGLPERPKPPNRMPTVAPGG